MINRPDKSYCRHDDYTFYKTSLRKRVWWMISHKIYNCPVLQNVSTYTLFSDENHTHTLILSLSLFDSHHTLQTYTQTSLKAYGRPRMPAPMNDMKMLAKILILLSVPSSCMSRRLYTNEQTPSLYCLVTLLKWNFHLLTCTFVAKWLPDGH